MNDFLHILVPLLILGILGGLFGLLLSFAAKKFAVKKDEKAEKLQNCLPGANCGACGFPGCSGYAEAVARGEARVGLCVPGGEDASRKMAEIMGTEAGTMEKKTAFVHCAGTNDRAEKRFRYNGINSCLAASVLPGGSIKECRFGCLGFGDCVSACRFDAISVENGIARVDRSLCTGCGACAKVCPQKIISLIPAGAETEVFCSNTQKGPEVKKNCKVGCIGCTLCARNCPEKAITMLNNLPKVDASLCTGCGTCTLKCPVHAIVLLNGTAQLNASEQQ